MVDPLDVALEVERWFEEQGFVVITRDTPDGVAVDLVGDINPAVKLRGYGLGPDTVLAVLAAEQRWLAEEEGRGSVAGETYVEKAQERLRRALDVPWLPICTPLFRQSGVVNQCCFCDAAVDPSEDETLTVVVSAASRVEDSNAPTQQMWCHAHCLGDRLSDAVPFEASAFDD